MRINKWNETWNKNQLWLFSDQNRFNYQQWPRFCFVFRELCEPQSSEGVILRELHFVPLNIHKTHVNDWIDPFFRLSREPHFKSSLDENLPLIVSYCGSKSLVSYNLSYDLYFTDLFMEGKLRGARTCLLFSTVQAKLFPAGYPSGTLQWITKKYQVTLANSSNCFH